MTQLPVPRVTPWVGRLIAANAVVLLLSLTIFTPESVQHAARFDPQAWIERPWSFVTYMFAHGGLLHLLGNALLLFFFGGPLESRMGGRRFLLYYLYCGVGAAVFALGLAQITSIHPFIGASGAALGLAFGFAHYWPDAEVMAFPLPVPIKARTLVAGLVALDVALHFLSGGNDGVAHIAHVGGVIAGYAFFRLQGLANGRPVVAPSRGSGPVERVVMVQSGAAEDEPPRRTPVTPIRPRRRIEVDPVSAEIDRVLDKISEHGMSSLTAAERRFLDEVSRRKKQDMK
jgi:membrane associated rhomboid family serine protease